MRGAGEEVGEIWQSVVLGERCVFSWATQTYQSGSLCQGGIPGCEAVGGKVRDWPVTRGRRKAGGWREAFGLDLAEKISELTPCLLLLPAHWAFALSGLAFGETYFFIFDSPLVYPMLLCATRRPGWWSPVKAKGGAMDIDRTGTPSSSDA